MTRSGFTFPFANLANTETLGTLTQFGTMSASRLVSYAAADAFVNVSAGVPAGALRMIRLGLAFPLAVRSNTTAEWSE